MSSKMQLPLSQVRHSNVAVVKYVKNGVKLELACYKNKVLNYRNGLETRLDEVMQIDRIFTNVSRGSYAADKDIHTAMGTSGTIDVTAVIRHILEHGELQIAQQERTSEMDEMIKDIANVISQKCVHVATGRPFPPAVIEQSLRAIGAVVKLDQPVKKQALTLIKHLIDANVLPIRRAMMKLRCTAPSKETLAAVLAWCEANGAAVDNSSSATVSSAAPQSSGVVTDAPVASISIGILVQPHLFRDLDSVCKQSAPGTTLDVIENAVIETGEGAASDIAVEMENAVAFECAGGGGIKHSSAGDPSGHSSKGGDHANETGKAQVAHSSPPEKKADKKKKTKKSHDEDDDDVEGPRPGLHLKADDDDDDEDDDAKRKKKKKSKAPPAPAEVRKKLPQPPPKAVDEEDDDDVVSERKKSKKHSKPAEAPGPFEDDENFDYGEDDDGQE